MKLLSIYRKRIIDLLVSIFLLLLSDLLIAQKIISGKITDSNNQPVAGSTISVKGTNLITQSDFSGNFSVFVPAGKKAITVSSVGYIPQEVNVADQNTVSVSLQTATYSLEEVVVTGYVSERKREITGSVAVVNVSGMK